MKIAFAGFRHGHIWALYNSAVSNPEIEVVGCFEEDSSAREAAEQKIGKRFEFGSFDEILQNPRIDTVAIGDYYAKRGSLAIASLKAGKHVICDKPICTSLCELDEIERISREKGLQVSCMLDLRYIPHTAKAKEIIKSEILGKINIISFTGQHPLSYGSRPKWYFEEGKHGGTINDIAIHGIDLLRYLLGRDITEVEYAKTWNAFAEKEPSFKDCGQFIAKMGDITINADVSYSAPRYSILPTYWRFEFWGTEAMMSFCLAEKKIDIYGKEHKVIELEDSSSEFLRDMLLEIKGEKTVLGRDDILKSQRQVLEIQKAADEA